MYDIGLQVPSVFLLPLSLMFIRSLHVVMLLAHYFWPQHILHDVPAPHFTFPPTHVLSNHGLEGSTNHLTQLGSLLIWKGASVPGGVCSHSLLGLPPSGQRPQSSLVKSAGSGPGCLDSESCLYYLQLIHVASGCLHFLVCKMLTATTQGIVMKIKSEKLMKSAKNIAW